MWVQLAAVRGTEVPLRLGCWGSVANVLSNEWLQRFAEGDRSSLKGSLDTVSLPAPDLVESVLLAVEQAWRTWLSGHVIRVHVLVGVKQPFYISFLHWCPDTLTWCDLLRHVRE